MAEVRTDTPKIPRNPFFVQPLKYAGVSTADKVEQVRKKLASAGANTQIITMLDEAVLPL